MDIQNFTMDFFSLKGKNAIVTGGNTGLGQSFAMALAKAGANLFIPSILDDDGQTKDLIEAEGVGHEFMKIDITEEGAPRKIIETCVEKLGAIDILVNSAGISILEEVQNFGREQWDKMVRINLTAAFELSFEASKFMIPQKSGKIINICSLFSLLRGQMSPAYLSTKHGLAGLTKTYCDELAQHNIQVNGIGPGYFATEQTKPIRVDGHPFNDFIVGRTPAGRWGEPEDLQGAAVFLASSASDFVNGQIIYVDGGILATIGKPGNET